jgi:hypothetical protein
MPVKEKLTAYGKDFESSKDLSDYTEKMLMDLQDKFLDTRDEKYVNRMFKELKKYAKSILLGRFSSYIANISDLDMKSYFVTKEVIMQYYRRSDFKISTSFGSYLIHKARQIVFNKKYDYDMDSCSNYIVGEPYKSNLVNRRLHVVPDAISIDKNSFVLYAKEKGSDEWEQIATDNGQGEIHISHPDYRLNDGWINYRLRTFLVDISNLEETEILVRMECRIKREVVGKSLDAMVSIGKTKLPFGVTLPALGVHSEIENNVEQFDDYNVVQHIVDIINETSQIRYSGSRRLNFHRLIAIRNRILFGEDCADQFFHIISRDARMFYERTMDIIYNVLNERV